MADVTADAMKLVRTAHRNDTIGYARITSRLRRTQYEAPVLRELVDLFLSLLSEIHHDDPAAVQKYLDDFDAIWQRMLDEDHR